MALGALRLLEPRKAWVFEQKGTDTDSDPAMRSANSDIENIFDVTSFAYDITRPTFLRGQFEAVLNSIESGFRLIVVSSGPNIFCLVDDLHCALGKLTFGGGWTFSSKEQAIPVDQDAEVLAVWHQTTIEQLPA